MSNLTTTADDVTGATPEPDAAEQVVADFAADGAAEGEEAAAPELTTTGSEAAAEGEEEVAAEEAEAAEEEPAAAIDWSGTTKEFEEVGLEPERVRELIGGLDLVAGELRQAGYEDPLPLIGSLGKPEGRVAFAKNILFGQEGKAIGREYMTMLMRQKAARDRLREWADEEDEREAAAPAGRDSEELQTLREEIAQLRRERDGEKLAGAVAGRAKGEVAAWLKRNPKATAHQQAIASDVNERVQANPAQFRQPGSIAQLAQRIYERHYRRPVAVAPARKVPVTPARGSGAAPATSKPAVRELTPEEHGREFARFDDQRKRVTRGG